MYYVLMYADEHLSRNGNNAEWLFMLPVTNMKYLVGSGGCKVSQPSDWLQAWM